MTSRDLTPWPAARSMSRLAADPFRMFRQEMDRLFDNFIPAETRSFAGFSAPWPSVDVDEDDRKYTVTAELAGLDRDDLKLDLRDNVLTLSGEKRQSETERENGRLYAERYYGKFERVIPFDSEIDGEKVQADFKHGVLTITLPKNPRAAETSRRIQINASDGQDLGGGPQDQQAAPQG